jgi:hypothetical protein
MDTIFEREITSEIVVGKGNQGLYQSLLGCIAESKYDISPLYFGA